MFLIFCSVTQLRDVLFSFTSLQMHSSFVEVVDMHKTQMAYVFKENEGKVRIFMIISDPPSRDCMLLLI